MRVTLNIEALEALNMPIIGNGGFQSFMRKLQNQCQNGVLTYDDADLQTLIGYSNNYGSGGYENRFRAILDCINEI